jgi:hypothetical protein
MARRRHRNRAVGCRSVDDSAGALVRLITILIVAAALPCRAEDVISGRWEGTARVPDDELTVVVDLAQENGA